MATLEFLEEFACIKNAIGMGNEEACYLLQKRLLPKLKDFLAHHILPTNYNNLVQEILCWAPWVKQLPPWKPTPRQMPLTKKNNPDTLPLSLISKEGRGYQLSDTKRKLHMDKGCCIYCGKKGHQAKDCFALNHVQQTPSAVLAAANPNKSTNKSYASFPVTIKTSQGRLDTFSLLDTGAMGNVLDHSILKLLRIEDYTPSLVLLANKSSIHVNCIFCPIETSRSGASFTLDYSTISGLTFPVIIGYPWCEQARMNINWDTHQIEFTNLRINFSVPIGQYNTHGHTKLEFLSSLGQTQVHQKGSLPYELLHYESFFSDASCNKLLSHKSLDLRIEGNCGKFDSLKLDSLVLDTLLSTREPSAAYVNLLVFLA
ncbi:hypothetical protein DSO57_1031912 [Entomophthora muscae]|uniref:Uncharacterized protein n=1 Tax=Entomophthora muscae TaxID=34485 RepID=A0ACC2RRK6_9FUNG|nr:hypothetical protein DSO57_1031912 [Entomophthora muscae]